MRDSTSLPDLRLLPISLLVPHEETDPRRVEKLAGRILEEGRLKNPPIVAPIPETDRFVILDGANRAMAFNRLGIPHIVVQVVSYDDPGVVLDTWYHVIAGMSLDEFEERIRQVTDMQLEACTLKEAREALASNEAAAYIVCESGVRKVCNANSSCMRDIHLLNRIVAAYKGCADIYRASNDIWEIQKPYYPNITALIIFPQFSTTDILEIARDSHWVPTGVTRHIVSPRAVNINIPIGVLWAGWPMEQKEQWLRDWLMERMGANAIRYYAESTFTFDE